jgi:hypothetical protein
MGRTVVWVVVGLGAYLVWQGKILAVFLDWFLERGGLRAVVGALIAAWILFCIRTLMSLGND